jgi:hypothetical protein
MDQHNLNKIIQEKIKNKNKLYSLVVKVFNNSYYLKKIKIKIEYHNRNKNNK